MARRLPTPPIVPPRPIDAARLKREKRSSFELGIEVGIFFGGTLVLLLFFVQEVVSRG